MSQPHKQSPRPCCAAPVRWRNRRLAGTAVLVLCLATVATMATVSPAEAKPSANSVKQAEALSRDAVVKFRAGEFDAAAKLFLQAYQLARKPTSVFNAARAKESAGRDAEAKALYELYLRLGESADGVVDARQRIAAIDGREASKRALAEKRMAESSAAAERERLRAGEATRRADEARRARLVAQQQLGAMQAAEAARKKRASAAPRDGLVVLPGASSVQGRGNTALLERMAILLAGEAASASIGGVRGHTTLRGTLARHPGGAAACSLACRLAMARKLGAAFAAGVSLYGKPGALHARVVLWRTTDGTEAGEVEITGADANAVLTGSMIALGDVFNGVRRYAVQPAQAVTPVAGTPRQAAPPAGTVAVWITSEPRGAQVFIDERPVGAAPVRAHVAIGAHRVRVVARHHRRRGGRFVASVGGGRVHIVLPTQLVGGQAASAGRRTLGPGARAIPGHDRRAGVQRPGRQAPTTGQAHGAATRGPAAGSRNPPVAGSPAAARGGPPPAHRSGGGPGEGQGQVQGGSTTALRGNPGQQQAGRAGANAQGANAQGSNAQGSNGRRSTTPRRNQAASKDDSGAGVAWGVVLSLGGVFSTHDDAARYADVAPGGYVMAHLGIPRSREIPWVYFAVGGGAELYQGMPGSVDGPPVFSAFFGVGFPRAAGLLVGVRHHWIVQDLPVGEFNFTAVEARIVSARRALYFAIGTRVLLRSSRPSVDAFSGGPMISAFVELGWSIGGRGLSR